MKKNLKFKKTFLLCVSPVEAVTCESIDLDLIRRYRRYILTAGDRL